MNAAHQFDVGIIGGGPAGLSAAIVLGRCCHRVVVIDSGTPRNHAAKKVNCFLGAESVSPTELRERGRRQATEYGVLFVSDNVVEASTSVEGHAYTLTLRGSDPLSVRKLILATGVSDVLPEIEGIADFYGTSVHHCPFCDGWEHSGERIVAIGQGQKVAKLALSLSPWSNSITACSMGERLSESDCEQLSQAGIGYRPDTALRMHGYAGRLHRIEFDAGEDLLCDCAFFSGPQIQQSDLATQLGCSHEREGQMRTGKKQATAATGVFLAGDIDGDVQFAIVAAAEGAIAATAVHKELVAEDLRTARGNDAGDHSAKDHRLRASARP